MPLYRSQKRQHEVVDGGAHDRSNSKTIPEPDRLQLQRRILIAVLIALEAVGREKIRNAESFVLRGVLKLVRDYPRFRSIVRAEIDSVPHRQSDGTTRHDTECGYRRA